VVPRQRRAPTSRHHHHRESRSTHLLWPQLVVDGTCPIRQRQFPINRNTMFRLSPKRSLPWLSAPHPRRKRGGVWRPGQTAPPPDPMSAGSASEAVARIRASTAIAWLPRTLFTGAHSRPRPAEPRNRRPLRRRPDHLDVQRRPALCRSPAADPSGRLACAHRGRRLPPLGVRASRQLVRRPELLESLRKVLLISVDDVSEVVAEEGRIVLHDHSGER
jgi:hypothetical protein